MVSFSQKSQASLREAIFQDFKGLSRRSDRLNTSSDFLYDLLNGYVRKEKSTGRGIIIQRNGSDKFNTVQLSSGTFGSATAKVRTIYEAKWNGGSVDVIIRAGTAWGKFDGVDTFTGLDTGRADDVYGQCAMFKNELIMVDGGIPRKSTAAYVVSALSSDANMPQDSTAVWVHRDKLWLNSSSSPMIAYFSKTNSANGATSWTGSTDAGTIDLSTILPDGDTIIGFRTFGGQDSGLIAIICSKYTVIFKAGANVYTFDFVQYFPTTCISINACDYIGKNIVYPSMNNFTSLDASVASDSMNVNTLSDQIDLLYRQFVQALSDTSTIAGTYDKSNNLFYLLFPIVNNQQVLIYSVDIGNFVGRFNYPFNIYSVLYRRNGTLLAGGEGYVYILDTGDDDDGTAISFKVSMPAIYFGTPSKYKRLKEFEAFLSASSDTTIYIDYWFGVASLNNTVITEQITIDASSSLWDESLWDVSYWDTGGNEIFRTRNMVGRGRLMILEIKHSTLGSKVLIPWFILRYILEGAN